ncbi:phage major capsid protein [Cohaesibacter celericrescens]|uniref:Phage major capsid protein n=1 Tax=Cohaesibacter celericrescens TaxID=2067669 RepID=A0A2N5XQU3_9HYPH|nr:phage major capsid protein [Cohaesibacter celericrescens]PLW76810.1 phage major capsid protein [Cohaesibacter celericrescens]
MEHVKVKSLAGTALETKDAGDLDAEVKKLIEGIGTSFEEYKKTNDQRMQEIEKRGSADVVTEQKLAKIDADLGDMSKLKEVIEAQKSAIEDLAKKANRPRGGNGLDNLNADQIEHQKAFEDYIKKGAEGNLGALQTKALSASVDAEGGYAVPEHLDQDIIKRLKDVSPVRSVCRNIMVSVGNYKKPAGSGAAASGWVGEKDVRPKTDSPGLNIFEPSFGEMYAMPAATRIILDDAFFNVEAWLAEEVESTFAEKEGVAFVSGDGVNKPKGFLTHTTDANKDGSRTYGNIQHVLSGAAGGFAANDATDALINLFYALKAGYRQNAKWMMNSQTVSEVRKLKDSNGNYIWQPGLSIGEATSLLERPVVSAEEMPQIAADSLSIALADWERAYTVIDRMGTQVLRDPFSEKGFILFYTTKRVGGGMENDDAIKLMKFAA